MYLVDADGYSAIVIPIGDVGVIGRFDLPDGGEQWVQVWLGCCRFAERGGERDDDNEDSKENVFILHAIHKNDTPESGLIRCLWIYSSLSVLDLSPPETNLLQMLSFLQSLDISEIKHRRSGVNPYRIAMRSDRNIGNLIFATIGGIKTNAKSPILSIFADPEVDGILLQHTQEQLEPNNRPSCGTLAV